MFLSCMVGMMEEKSYQYERLEGDMEDFFVFRLPVTL